MSTLEQPSYDLSSTVIPDTLWTHWRMAGSPEAIQDDGSCRLDLAWQPTMHFFGESRSVNSDNWSDQCMAPFSTFSPVKTPLSMGGFSESAIDAMNTIPSFDTYTFAATSAPPNHETSRNLLHQQSLTYQDHISGQPSLSLSRTSHSSLESTHDRPAALLPSPHANTKSNRGTKTPIRCFEHSCGGRPFSSPGNYERHLREKSGRAKSFTCEHCGQRFTRSTAKNKHIRYGRCRGVRDDRL